MEQGSQSPRVAKRMFRRFGHAVPEKCGWIGRHIASPVGVEDCRHVVLRVLVGGVAEQKAGLADSAIAHNNNLLPDRGTRRRGLGRYLVDFGYRVLITGTCNAECQVPSACQVPNIKCRVPSGECFVSSGECGLTHGSNSPSWCPSQARGVRTAGAEEAG
eukprot:CAMPEP_0119476090 /NCGR_PEP_ID=MMETSP1344-20130328/6740_1 /TAXON_ID=236787 /ORGANISM="Florenciella parvula, Strain CCMP2471" /LENGTH=159 /DNA_ID=CAMNT_0007509775 /DNA_START=391 /DNA_END=866 /DNA_ORIENTATION=+